MCRGGKSRQTFSMDVVFVRTVVAGRPSRDGNQPVALAKRRPGQLTARRTQ